MAASPRRRLTRKELNQSLKRQIEQRWLVHSQRHVTHNQIFMALHDLVFEFDSAITISQIQRHVTETDESVRDLPPNELTKEIFQTLMEGVICNWCRCVKPGFFKPTSEPPPKTEADKNKEKLLKAQKEQSKGEANGYAPPRNLVIHGEVSNEDEVPGFMVTVDEFVEFMKRVQEKVGPLPPVKL